MKVKVREGNCFNYINAFSRPKLLLALRVLATTWRQSMQ